jgi:Mg/Co/Ni transporter MgtE
MNQWIQTAKRRDVVIRATRVGVIVGTILTAINQGDLILAGNIDQVSGWKILLTYLVPYSVSTYAAVSAILDGES